MTVRVAGGWLQFKSLACEYLPACPLGSVPPGPHPRARPAIYIPPSKIPCSNGSFPVAWPLGQQREEQGDLFIFSLTLLAIFSLLAFHFDIDISSRR